MICGVCVCLFVCLFVFLCDVAFKNIPGYLGKCDEVSAFLPALCS